MPPMNFGVSDKELAATIEKMEGGKMSQSFLISNEPLYVNHFNSIFEELWINGMDAADRIRAVEEGIFLSETQVILVPSKIQELFIHLIKSAKEEILLILPTINAFYRKERLGIIQLLKEATLEGSVDVRLLTPSDEVTEQKYVV
jgi:phosphatidylserine/phosphatidylglycerophosphate/cardiolipin synthase-like enzyme